MIRSQQRSVSLEVIANIYKLLLARLVPLRWRVGLYKSYVRSLSDTAWEMYGGRVAQTLWFSRRDSRLFKNTEHQLAKVLVWMPRFVQYRGVMRDHIKAQRKHYGLKQ